MHDTIGVDISKDRLDAFALKTQEHRQFSNTRAGHKAFAGLGRARGLAACRIRADRCLAWAVRTLPRGREAAP